MRQRGESGPHIPHRPLRPRSDPAPTGLTLQRLLPYLWQYKWRVVAAIAFHGGAKLANVGVPCCSNPGRCHGVQTGRPGCAAGGAVGLLVAYGALRLSTSLFTELRELVFAKGHAGRGALDCAADL